MSILPWDFVEPQVCYPTSYTSIKYNGKRINKSRSIRDITNEDLLYSLKIQNSLSTIQIPEEFSWRKTGGNKIEQPREQGGCGCCWCMAVSAVFGDRISIKFDIPSIYPSCTWLLANTYKEMGNPPQYACENGGDPVTAIIWLAKNGTKVEKCWPYSLIADHDYISPNSLPDNCCMTCCDPDYIKPYVDTFLKVKPNSIRNLVVQDSTGYYINEENTTRLIQYEIMTRGPVLTTFKVFKDFDTYWKNLYYNPNLIYIFDDTPSNYTGGHAVSITGWGSDLVEINVGTKREIKKLRYWEIRNSWGTISGDKGYCRIAFSLDAPSNKNIEIDIPKILIPKGPNTSMVCSGGVISFLPDDNLSDGVYEILNIKNPNTTPPPTTTLEPTNVIYKKTVITIILRVILGFMIFILVYSIFIYFRDRSRNRSLNKV